MLLLDTKLRYPITVQLYGMLSVIGIIATGYRSARCRIVHSMKRGVRINIQLVRAKSRSHMYIIPSVMSTFRVELYRFFQTKIGAVAH